MTLDNGIREVAYVTGELGLNSVHGIMALKRIRENPSAIMQSI